MTHQPLTPEEQRAADNAQHGILLGDSDGDAIEQLMELTASATGQDIDELRQASTDTPS